MNTTEFHIVLNIIFNFTGCLHRRSYGNRAQYGLVKHLLTNYSTDVRPIEHNNKTITIYVGIAVNQLIDMVLK